MVYVYVDCVVSEICKIGSGWLASWVRWLIVCVVVSPRVYKGCASSLMAWSFELPTPNARRCVEVEKYLII